MRYDRGQGRWGEGYGGRQLGYDRVYGNRGGRPHDSRYDAGYGGVHLRGGLTTDPRTNMRPRGGETDFLGRRYRGAAFDTRPRGLYDQEYRQAEYDRDFGGMRGYARDFRGDEAGFGLGRRYGRDYQGTGGPFSGVPPRGSRGMRRY